MPKTFSDYAAIVSANELIYALKNLHPASPLAPIQDDQVTALQQLSQIFKSTVSTNEDPPVPPRVIASDKPNFQKNAIGNKITKIFDDVPYNGVITAFDTTVKYYHIKYDDDNEENMDGYQIKHHLAMDKSDWTVVEKTGTFPRVEFEPSTYNSATRNSGQRRHQKVRLTKAAAKWLSTLALIYENKTKGADHYLTPLKQYESLLDTYEGAVHSRTVQKTPTKLRFDPKTKYEQYRIANKASNYPNPLSSIATLATPFSREQLHEHFSNAAIHPDSGTLLEKKGSWNKI